MGVWDYISSTANTLIPVWNLLYFTSTSYGQSATTKFIAAVPNAAQFATTFAKHAAIFACRQGLKTIPGEKPIYDIVSRSFHDSQKNDQQKKPKLGALDDQEKLDLRAVIRALEDQEKQIKETSFGPVRCTEYLYYFK
ncbi:hypothetical protein M5689_010518 [Euphorbia peplus]|nr:hypothetical protein M5689_010518 [Euphorbia peplus]